MLPDKGKGLLADTKANMIAVVEDESNFKSRNISNFVLAYAIKLQEHLCGAVKDDIPTQIAITMAVKDLWKHYNIEMALKDLYVQEAFDKLGEAWEYDSRRWRTGHDVLQSIEGRNDAIHRIFA